MVMRKLLLAGAALFVGSCSANESGGAGDGVSSSSPGRAWQFNYDFLLADKRIEQVQERHGARCEQLGPARCRITGMRYSVNEDDGVSGELQVKLNPAIARRLGRLALEDVRTVEGKLVRTEFVGEDVGTGVANARSTGDELTRQIADLQQRIDAAQVGSPERAELQRQLEALNARASEQRDLARGGEERLAATPVTFHYFGEGGIPGFRENPVRESFKLMASSFVTMISFVLKAVGVLLPWALLLTLLVLVWRSRPVRAARRWWQVHAEPQGYRQGDGAAV